MTAPMKVADLVGRFSRNEESYLSSQYNETQVRREFIDPLFKALGWDIDNTLGTAEAFKEVIHEYSVKIGGDTRAPDYCFRAGGVRKFFVEAKRPSVRIREDSNPAFQLRRYAWSAKLPLSILTDFHELSVYDCRYEPLKTDKASTARLLYMSHTEYLERWEELASVFSRDAVFSGSFDRYAESTRAARGVAEVDEKFLDEIESWRRSLARSFANLNTTLTQRELNYAVQQTIDRIIFLRICEDRGIEPYGELRSLGQGGSIYTRLGDLFQRADERYNSGLFHFSAEGNREEEPDRLTLDLAVDDRPLKAIIRRLYYPDSPYEFSVLPTQILGQVYEQFLGKMIRLKGKGRAVVEDKPELKKAGGVYYTPEFIVNYIVRNTLDSIMAGKSLRQVTGDARTRRAAPLRVLDMACGSGSFLIAAYQYLLDWYRSQYVSDDPMKWSRQRTPTIYEASDGEWRLTTAERKGYFFAMFSAWTLTVRP